MRRVLNLVPRHTTYDDDVLFVDEVVIIEEDVPDLRTTLKELKRRKKTNQEGKQRIRLCYRCHKPGHTFAACLEPPAL